MERVRFAGLRDPVVGRIGCLGVAALWTFAALGVGAASAGLAASCANAAGRRDRAATSAAKRDDKVFMGGGQRAPSRHGERGRSNLKSNLLSTQSWSTLETTPNDTDALNANPMLKMHLRLEYRIHQCFGLKTPLPFCRVIVLIAMTTSLDLLAQTRPTDPPSGDGGRKELKEAAATQEVQQELESPDGVALQLLPDGAFRLYGRGSGTYDFNEADEIRGANQDATLRAKAAIAKFLKERIQSADSMKNTSVKMKKLTASSGEAPKAEITKNDVQTRVEQISSRADEVMAGLVIISSTKKPIGNGGEIQVTIGWSSKTRGTAEAIRAGKPVPGAGSSAGQGKGGTKAVGTLTEENLPQTKQNKTDF